MKQVIYVGIIVCIAYICVRPMNLKGEFKENIKNAKCKNVWGFMADFR